MGNSERYACVGLFAPAHTAAHPTPPLPQSRLRFNYISALQHDLLQEKTNTQAAFSSGEGAQPFRFQTSLTNLGNRLDNRVWARSKDEARFLLYIRHHHTQSLSAWNNKRCISPKRYSISSRKEGRKPAAPKSANSSR